MVAILFLLEDAQSDDDNDVDNELDVEAKNLSVVFYVCVACD